MWTSYCLVDSYFDDATNQNSDLALSYYILEDERDVVDRQLDPLSMGQTTTGTTLLRDPREYFLLIWRWRAKHFKEEWENTGCQLQKHIHRYVGSYIRRVSFHDG
ncbi:hypothetical protein CTRI78_v002621 [Colletotrichum trifolii]|uniref:Uncharacterized protein n=1 Tax=Colletotrichum trifolii TaxID=5466 RepID=A0A4R8RLG4_COLTR|nr:hypothetical protein CTRI78_v002621 [Colletotrichum trifolii]